MNDFFQLLIYLIYTLNGHSTIAQCGDPALAIEFAFDAIHLDARDKH